MANGIKMTIESSYPRLHLDRRWTLMHLRLTYLQILLIHKTYFGKLL